MRISCVGLQCPMPGINTRKALDLLEEGEVLEVTTDGLAGRSDVPRMAKRLGYTVVKTEEQDGVYVFFIKK